MRIWTGLALGIWVAGMLGCATAEAPPEGYRWVEEHWDNEESFWDLVPIQEGAPPCRQPAATPAPCPPRAPVMHAAPPPPYVRPSPTARPPPAVPTGQPMPPPMPPPPPPPPYPLPQR